MIDKDFVGTCIDNYNMRIELVERQVKEDGSFENAVSNLSMMDECINALEGVINGMKQERHDITQDVHNKFKEKNYVKTIKFV